MNFDDRRGRGRGRQRGQGSPDDFPSFHDDRGGFGERSHGGGYGGQGGGYGGGGGGGYNQGGGGGGGGRFGDMPDQVVGEGRGKVKFFNSQKGFGFIECEDRPDDVFVHISQVERAGLSSLAEGQELSFTLVDRRGRVSASNLRIEGEVVQAPRGGKPQGRFSRELTGERTSGTVKFFNSQKGYGFIKRDDEDNDVFVHISALHDAGLAEPTEGDRLEFDVAVDSRGKSAAVNLSRPSEG